MSEKKYVFFSDGRACWKCEIVSKGREGLTLRMYNKETFFPWHQIDRIEIARNY